MQRICKQQVEQMLRQAQAGYEERIAAELTGFEPPRHSAIAQWIKLARRYGMTSELQVARFMRLVYHACGGALHMSLPPDMRAILDDRRLTADDRLAALDGAPTASDIRAYADDTTVPRQLVQPCSPRPVPHWIEIRMVDSDSGKPARGVTYALTLSGGETILGYLDDDGRALVEALDEGGMCRIEFPELDQSVWSEA